MPKERKTPATAINDTADTSLQVKANPNPVAHDAQLVVSVPSDGDLNVDLYDIYGYKVADLFNAPCPAGILTISFKSELFPNGIYYCIAKTNGKNAYCEITITKARHALLENHSQHR